MSSIYLKLSLARQKFPTITKNKTADTGKYKYNYADLQTVLEAVTPALREQGLELVQTVQVGLLQTALVSTTATTGGPPPLISEVELPTGATPQQLGSAITYARRYAIVCMLGLVTEEDDDASEASGVSATTRTRQPKDLPVAEVPAAPEGWESDEIALAAHNDLRDRIIALPDDFADQCVKFRKDNGWPLAPDKFAELEEIVRLAEGFGATS